MTTDHPSAAWPLTVLRVEQRVREATANLNAARIQIEQTPDDVTAQAWLESAMIEAQDAMALGQEVGL